MEYFGWLCCMFTPVAILGLVLGVLATVISIQAYLDLRRATPRQRQTSGPDNAND